MLPGYKGKALKKGSSWLDSMDGEGRDFLRSEVSPVMNKCQKTLNV